MLNFDVTVGAEHGIPSSIVDASGLRLIVSDQFAGLLQRPTEDLLGMPWNAIAHPGDIAAIQVAVGRILETGEPATMRRRLIRADGSMVEAVLFGSRQVEPRAGRFLVQSNVRLVAEPVAVDADILRVAGPSAESLVDYISQLTADLSRLAKRHDMPFLDHLLSMAHAEAAKELVSRQQQRENTRGMSSPTSPLH